jgi:hypothetical protein
MGHVVKQRAGHADRIDPVVLVKALVFGGDDGLGQLCRHVILAKQNDTLAVGVGSDQLLDVGGRRRPDPQCQAAWQAQRNGNGSSQSKARQSWRQRVHAGYERTAGTLSYGNWWQGASSMGESRPHDH